MKTTTDITVLRTAQWSGAGTFYIDIPYDLGFYDELIFGWNLTIVSGGGDTITLQLQDSPEDDGTMFTDISGANFGGAQSAVAYYREDLTSFARYIRVKVTTVNTANGAIFTFKLDILAKS